MPGHGDPFSDLANRVAAIEQHHDNRLNTTLDILRDGPQDVYAIAKRLFGQRMHDYNVVLGCAEAQAHLELLEDQGQAMLEGSHYRLA